MPTTGYTGPTSNSTFSPYQQQQLYGGDTMAQMQSLGTNLREFGNWEPWMTSAAQFVQDPGFTKQADYLLGQYNKLSGGPDAFAAKQAYYNMMGGNAFGGVVKPPPDLFGQPQYDRSSPPNPWGTLNSMGISGDYSMPTWQDNYFMAQADTLNPKGGQTIDNYNPWYQGGGQTMPSYGTPSTWTAQDKNDFGMNPWQQGQWPTGTGYTAGPSSIWGQHSNSPWG